MSDTRFTASNGFYVENGQVYLPDGTRANADLSSVRAVVLIEYGAHQAQAQRDAELGRWRSVEHPDWVVYPHTATLASDRGYRECQVIDERTGSRYRYGSNLTQRYLGEAKEAAREYFAAHPVPEPKPWEDAGSGELWSLMTADGDAVYLAILADDFGMEFVGLKDRFSVGYTGITAGRRIWPEATA